MSVSASAVGGSERGSATIELAVLAPALLALLGLVIVAGRISAAASAVEQAAAAAAREASLARDGRAAEAGAARVARDALEGQGVQCSAFLSRVEASGFGAAVGTAASVRVQVSCAVPLSDVVVPGMPGTRLLTASMASPLDRFRSRS